MNSISQVANAVAMAAVLSGPAFADRPASTDANVPRPKPLRPAAPVVISEEPSAPAPATPNAGSATASAFSPSSVVIAEDSCPPYRAVISNLVTQTPVMSRFSPSDQ
jgi:hypothetical protein